MLHDAADKDIGPVADRVHIDLYCILQKRVEENRMRPADPHRLMDIGLQFNLVVHQLHRTPAEDIGRPYQKRETNRLCNAECLLFRVRRPIRRRRDPELFQKLAEPFPVFCHVHRIRSSAKDCGLQGAGLQRPLQRQGKVNRVLAAELHHHARIIVRLQDVCYILKRHRLKEKPVRGVIVSRNGLRIVVDDMHLNAFLTESHHRMHGTVVKLNTLPNTNGAGSEDEHLLFFVRDDLGLVFPG